MTEGRYKQIIDEVAEIKEQRGKMYRTEPKDIVPIEILEAVALLKAYRGYEGISIEKKIDEYRDLMNYSAFIIERLQDAQKQERINAKHFDFGMVSGCVTMTSSQQTTNVSGKKCFGTYGNWGVYSPCNECDDASECIMEKQRRYNRPGCFGGYDIHRELCLSPLCNARERCQKETKSNEL